MRPKPLLGIVRDSNASCFAHTSSASVIGDAKMDMVAADETFRMIDREHQPEFYVYTKVWTSFCCLLSATAPNFLTCAIRPSGIIGVNDLVVLPGILSEERQGCKLAQTRTSLISRQTRMSHMLITSLRQSWSVNTTSRRGHAMMRKSTARPSSLPMTSLITSGISRDRSGDWRVTRLSLARFGPKAWALLIAGVIKCVY